MDRLGINWAYLILQLLILGAWLILALAALVRLRRAPLHGTSQAIWAALILVIPIMGALAFFIVRPGDSN